MTDEAESMSTEEWLRRNDTGRPYRCCVVGGKCAMPDACRKPTPSPTPEASLDCEALEAAKAEVGRLVYAKVGEGYDYQWWKKLGARRSYLDAILAAAVPAYLTASSIQAALTEERERREIAERRNMLNPAAGEYVAELESALTPSPTPEASAERRTITDRTADEALIIAAQMPTDRMGMDVVREWLAANEHFDV